MNALRFLLTACLLLIAVPVLARGGYEAVAFKTMRLERLPQSALAVAACQICHVNPKGDAPWNSFGLAVGFWRGKKQTIQDAIYSALRYGGDTDHDGYPDTFEFLAGTNQKDRDDKPSLSLDALKTRFDAGFKPVADSDGDGYPDALEAFAGSLPGDATSKPGEEKAALEARFLAAGGMELFKPVTK